jgi:hypothetical protein
LEIGRTHVYRTAIARVLGEERTLASLSEARAIAQDGWYWISAMGTEVKPGTWAGVPAKMGHYRDNRDGTFTKGERDAIDPSERLYVSRIAAENARKGEGPLYLIIGGMADHLYVWSGTWRGYFARVASVPKARAEAAREARRG